MEEYGKPISSIINFESPNEYYYFYIDKINKLKTKGGKPYYSLVVTDGASTKKLNMWDRHYESNKHIIHEGSFFISRFTKRDDFLNFDEKYPIREASI